MKSVTWVRYTVSLFLAVFWLGASSHVLLQSAGLIHNGEDCAPDHSIRDHAAADGHCLITHSDAGLQAPVLAANEDFTGVGGHRWVQAVQRVSLCGLAPPGEELRVVSGSLFCLRTALSPRAPTVG